MKTVKPAALGFALALGLCAAGCSSTSQNTGSAGQTDKVIVTGSYIPQDPPQVPIGNGPSYLRTVDEQQIQQSGQNNLRDVLIKQGAVP
jgi:hypothetical protein